MQNIKLPSKYVHDNFNQNIWDGDKLKKEISSVLKKISQDYYEFLKIDTPIDDIIFTGSLANYNWSNFSDIDLHIVIDYSKINKDEKLVEEYLAAKKELWNNKHDIKIKNFDVELYAQDLNGKLVATGVYSVKNDEWIKKPSFENPEIDKNSILKKIKSIIKQVEIICSSKDNELVQEKGKKLKDKIKKMRQSGLDKSGEFSEENLAFKYLRNYKILDKLSNKMKDSYDKSLTINEEDISTFEYDEKENIISSKDISKTIESNELKNKIEKFDFYKLGELPISKIKINPSTINIEKVEEYKEIIKINPDYSPLIYDSINNRIIDGAHRAEALKEMGYETVRAYISIPNENKIENMNESIRKIVRNTISEMFSSRGFHSSFEEWEKKWKEKENDNKENIEEKFKSKKQQAYFYSMANKPGKTGAKWKKMADEFSKNTNFKELKEEGDVEDFMKIDKFKKFDNISNIIFGLTGDDEKASDLIMHKQENKIYIPKSNFDKNEISELINLFKSKGYSPEETKEDIILDLNFYKEDEKLNLKNPKFNLNENIEIELLNPSKHNLYLEENIEQEHSKNLNDLKEFILFCCKEGNINEPTIVYLRGTRDEKLKTTASYNPNNHEVNIYCKGRHIVDIMRSLAHELMHMKQMIENRLYDNSGDDGSSEENEAHSFSGLMIRKFGKIEPKIYENYKNNKDLL